MLRACDVLIIGAGPAGIQAAIHASRRGARVIVLGRLAKSGLGKAWVENLLCILGQVQGYQLLLAGKKQAEAAGAVFIELDAVRLAKKDDSFECELEDGSKITCLAVILSTGITRERSPIRSEKRFIGRGISYCTDCDGPLFRGRRVAIVGWESAAVASAESLLSFASRVFLVDPESKMEESSRSRLGKMGVQFINKKPVDVSGADRVERLILEDGSSIEVDGVFIEMGSRGLLELAMPLGLFPNERGFLEVDRSQRTGVEGVFACGDITGPTL